MIVGLYRSTNHRNNVSCFSSTLTTPGGGRVIGCGCQLPSSLLLDLLGVLHCANTNLFPSLPILRRRSILCFREALSRSLRIWVCLAHKKVTFFVPSMISHLVYFLVDVATRKGAFATPTEALDAKPRPSMSDAGQINAVEECKAPLAVAKERHASSPPREGQLVNKGKGVNCSLDWVRGDNPSSKVLAHFVSLLVGRTSRRSELAALVDAEDAKSRYSRSGASLFDVRGKRGASPLREDPIANKRRGVELTIRPRRDKEIGKHEPSSPRAPLISHPGTVPLSEPAEVAGIAPFLMSSDDKEYLSSAGLSSLVGRSIRNHTEGLMRLITVFRAKDNEYKELQQQVSDVRRQMVQARKRAD
ncbi:unnamed protein product [Cuscuta epithymum]|uniref:Uncharacterized protein n=1 Tax=Cuscuta epithymum TaxID=186058 RepID=A0AAV0FT00_9ASTE|nr:unnamed protein product [Cuscuta epithymum]